ncbi:hypothetical protein [Mesorhizobium sp. CO1-1-9]|uniref:hypothetical protein n=1 Tax=Mesorhizobium sp. CO1-1-9 TaxID=2876630 RepID=UPI001CCAEED2|nr:hypothetical protein [Mesorhizobium sp. CO1-1-9]MBZ9694534.1 hypothetical protein [Mesorhizobium sp. CO1-1-9]
MTYLDEEMKRYLVELEARCETDKDRKHFASIKRTLMAMERDQARLLARLAKLPRPSAE